VAEERRKSPRLEISLPTIVEGHSGGAPWRELVRSFDASFGGVSFPLEHEVHKGHVLRLSLPLPKRLRRHDLTDPSYQVYAVVRSIVDQRSQARVGVMFLGQNPPAGYEDDPEGRFLLASDPQPRRGERRRYRRLQVFANFRIREENGPWEQTVAENLSKGGTRIMSAIAARKGQWLEIEESDGGFSTRVEVRNAYVGPDGIPRLNLRFEEPPPNRLVPDEDTQ
jgi:hypothetical protein